uniref:Sad1 and UNC84 domain containing 2 n=1 Tax=Astyanax mexicanus TaxID=7994 RepID=A0A3B1K8Z5_ASTMX
NPNISNTQQRSARLATSPYYAHDDDAASTSSTESNPHFSYRESPVRYGLHLSLPLTNIHFSCVRSSSQRTGAAARPLSRTTTPLISSSSTLLQKPDFSSGYSSAEENNGLHKTSTAGEGVPRALAMVYWWLGTAWYSLTSGMSLINVSLLSRLQLIGIVLEVDLNDCVCVCVCVCRPLQEKLTQAGLLTLRNEIYAHLQEREAEWTESRARDLDPVLVRVCVCSAWCGSNSLLLIVLSEHNTVVKQELHGIKQQISNLRSDVSDLQTSSKLHAHRLDVQESQNAKLKAELSDWLLQQLAVSVGSKEGVVMHPDLQRALEALEKKIMDRLGEEREKESGDVWGTVGVTLREEGAGELTVKDVERIVNRALSLYRADGVGMADYALESSGASVINTRCSETFHTKTACLSLFGIPLWYQSESPRTVTQPELYPGKCWAFRGSEGFLVIALSYPVRMTHVSLEHVPRSLSPTGRIDSAPKDFAVYGMTGEDAEGELLATFTYNQDGEPIQTFKLPDSPTEVYQLVELRILSNWGHPEYTCVYRFRVHGQPSNT